MAEARAGLYTEGVRAAFDDATRKAIVVPRDKQAFGEGGLETAGGDPGIGGAGVGIDEFEISWLAGGAGEIEQHTGVIDVD